MTFLSWVIVIALLGLIGRWLNHRWTAAAAPAPTTAANDQGDTARAVPFTVALRDGVAQLRANLFGAKPPSLTPQFRSWLTQVLVGEPQLYQWLSNLSDEQLDALTTHINTFCREMGFELSWLLDQQLAAQPILTQELNQVVIYYCQACYQSVILQEDLEPYRRLRQYEQNPNSAENRALGEALFEKFAEKGLTSITMAAFQALPEQARQQQIVASVRQSAAEQQGFLLRLIKELNAPPTVAPTVAPPAAPTVPTATHVNGSAGQAHA